MIVSEITVHSCSFDSRVCENYTCRQAKDKKKYFIGNPKGFGHKPIYCEDCIRHMVHNLPPELIEGGTDLESRLRAEITVEYNAVLDGHVKQMEIVKGQYESLIQALTANAEPMKEVIAEDQPEEKPEIKDAVFRCLDCGEEFETKRALASHKKAHN